ncbi:Mannan polymerase II complex ANP1 subunit [Choanephora cucurbitarum]|uniref:Mannan polymerase II complex ANP1 subunit n=1 Tax=Choanephora cucurbitarum TaxID=101091 RepID=A0A1C7NKC7_9FUNG|nr:Mannan polymerase II complex ANP1 subunit [Choanephora cucurbitarum]
MMSRSTSWFPRNIQRTIIVAIVLSLCPLLLWYSLNNEADLLSALRDRCSISKSPLTRTHSYLNLNNLNSTTHGRESGEHILVLTVLDHSEDYLDKYFNLLDATEYPNKLISVGLLLSDSSEESMKKVSERVQTLQARWKHKFFEIDVFQKDFQLDTKIDDISLGLESKRATIAKSKNFLLTAALREHHSWVVWIDVKLHSYPATIFSDLMLADADVIVPNCLQFREDGEFWAYDRNNWQESDLSLKKQKDLDASQVMMEDMPTKKGMEYKVPLDGVGTTFTMVKATVHREGAIFPPFVYQHHLDNEGFAKMAKSMGFSVYGIPGYVIYHY